MEALPEVILWDIISRLSPEDVATRVTPLSRYFRTLGDSPSLWRNFCGPATLTEDDASALGGWKDLFRRLFRSNLLCAPHFELLDTLQKEQKIYDLTAFEPERLSSWSLWSHSNLDSEEGTVGAEDYWLDPIWKWMPWEWPRGAVQRELRPVGCPPCPGAPWAPCLATGCATGMVAQRVGLKHFPAAFRDSRPAILVSAWYGGRSDCPSVFDLCVEFRRGRGGSEVLLEWSASDLAAGSNREMTAQQMLACPQGGWAKVEHLITDYDPQGFDEIRVVLFGEDQRFWAGWYGAKFTAVELRFVPPSEVHLYQQHVQAQQAM
ncbi:F-box containing protein [Klebsormidium nitens]|uniref:F-box containing protein n=1 Tax=Klebsormidium nitens TaxID=105231 RepID=A0A1Y1HUA6_KLENI|nr:F-box containing protein [Klebsormidium nitens]|eukprot:GAQ82215.1 F-box containing protein [Klebsormidium nitens]